jgi:hypothetical protein
VLVSVFDLYSDLEANLLTIRPTGNFPNPVRDNFRVADYPFTNRVLASHNCDLWPAKGEYL